MMKNLETSLKKEFSVTCATDTKMIKYRVILDELNMHISIKLELTLKHTGIM